MDFPPRFVTGWPHPRRGPGGQLATPPDSPRKRARLLRDSDELDGDITIESYLYRTNPYRSTTLLNPPPYPVRFHKPPQTETQPYIALYPDMERILLDHGFPSIHDSAREVDGIRESKGKFEFVHMSKPGYPGAQDPMPVFVVAFHEGGLPEDLGRARNAIREFLYSKGLRTDVEIFVREYFRQLTFPIYPFHNAVDVYNDAESAIIDSLYNNLGDMWEGLCLFNIGFSSSKVTPTVIVYVKPSSIFDWSSLRSELLVLTSSDPEIEISFRPGFISAAMNPGDSIVGNLTVQSIRPGSSIGVKGVSGSGTLGGYFDLQFRERVYRGFLTCYHVLAPSEETVHTRNRADKFGSSPDVDDETCCEAVTPSKQDVDNAIARISCCLDDLEAQRNRKEEVKDYLNSFGGSPSQIARVDADIVECNSKIRHFDYMRNLHRLLPKRLGKVLMSSGRTLFNGQVSDWAFAELDGTLLPVTNLMPSYQSNDFEFLHPHVAAPGTPATGFGEIREGELYVKHGRSTNVTSGLCNGVKIFQPHDVRYYVQGVEHVVNGTHEFIILATDGETNFSKCGDSGSLLYDVWGRISGLLFGQVEDPMNNIVTMVTTFSSILKAIEERGGVLTAV